jgi:hypothetical protein
LILSAAGPVFFFGLSPNELIEYFRKACQGTKGTRRERWFWKQLDHILSLRWSLRNDCPIYQCRVTRSYYDSRPQAGNSTLRMAASRQRIALCPVGK